tara:strand:+ start:712 stop:1665 length:954 start_codon:yes stop_codon:yes gene_type:complete
LKLKGIRHIATLDIINNDILIFNYDEGQLYKRISFNEDGPNALKGEISGYHIFHQDSILIIDKTNSLYFSNLEGEITKVLNLDPDGIPGAPLNRPNINPIVKIGKDYLLDNYYIMNEGRKMKIKLTPDDSIEYFQEVPNESLKGFWGIDKFVYTGFIYESDEEKFIYNFPNLDSLYIWNKSFNSLSKVNASSKNIIGPIKPILKFGVMPSEKTVKEEPFKRHIYTRIFKIGNNYVRLMGLPISQFDIDLRDPVKSRIRQYVAIVFDENFNWLGEFELPFNKYLIDSDDIFANDLGLHFQVKTGNENETKFEIWNIQN